MHLITLGINPWQTRRTFAGELVFEKTGITAGAYQWNAKNNQDEPVASGVYIYFLTDDTKEKKMGKIMIIR